MIFLRLAGWQRSLGLVEALKVSSLVPDEAGLGHQDSPDSLGVGCQIGRFDVSFVFFEGSMEPEVRGVLVWTISF